MKVAIIGAGLQARRRSQAIQNWPDAEISVITAKTCEEAKKLAVNFGCDAGEGWENTVTRSDIDIVLVCTPPDIHAAISIAALCAGKHVLCEKPLARTNEEANEMIKTAASTGLTLKCGFNHRHHPAIWKAKQMFDQGIFGDPIFGRCIYGICGRPGYEKEWRADPKVVSGGQFMEQGIHVVDLYRWFLGDFEHVTGYTSTKFFDISPLEDNAFALMQTPKGVIVSIHSSLTQWKNLFNFELYGSEGYFRVEGLGGGYGNEKLITAKRDFNAPFTEEVIEYRGEDRSWLEEWKEFLSAINEKREPLGNGNDGLEAMKLAYALYNNSQNQKILDLP